MDPSEHSWTLLDTLGPLGTLLDLHESFKIPFENSWTLLDLHGPPLETLGPS